MVEEPERTVPFLPADIGSAGGQRSIISYSTPTERNHNDDSSKSDQLEIYPSPRLNTFSGGRSILCPEVAQ